VTKSGRVFLLLDSNHHSEVSEPLPATGARRRSKSGEGYASLGGVAVEAGDGVGPQRYEVQC
jgi:hypothetical protein